MAPSKMHTRNADLAKYRDSTGALSQHPSAADKLLRFILQLLLVALWRSVKVMSVPFGKLFAAYFWVGKSVVTLSMFVEQQLLKAVGWLSGTGFPRGESRLARLAHFYFGMDVKRWHVGLVALVVGGLVTTVIRSIRNSFDERVRKSRWLRRLMAKAKSYDEWRGHAVQLEKVDGAAARGVPVHDDYDRQLLGDKLRCLKRTRATNNPREMMMALRIDLIRNVANIAKSQKRRQSLVASPEPIRQYLEEVKQQLELVASWPETELPLPEKMSYFQVTRHAYGRTALLLSGGGGLGTFHLGVCKALFERQLLPRVLAGSSVGSIVCAVIGTHTDQELKHIFADLKEFDIGFFQNSTAMDLARHALNNGHMQNMKFMTDKLKVMLGECTFLEAFERTGRILNITVCPADTNEPSRLLNYMTAPQVMVWSAVAASSSFPGLYPPQNLHGRNSKGESVVLHGKNGLDTMERRWRDGSLEFDLPVQTLGELFNCNHFLVSQTNPHIVPLVNFKSIFPHKWAAIMEAELKHRLQVVQWMLPEWKMSRYLTLFTQPWEGDITFTLPSMLWNLRKTIVNPSKAELTHAVEVGEHAAWEHMVAIECNCTIEATLDKCMTKLKRKGGATGMQSMATIGGKVPSWLHMPTPMPGPLGMSWGDGIADNDANPMASWGDFQNAGYDEGQRRYHGGSLDGIGRASDDGLGVAHGDHDSPAIGTDLLQSHTGTRLPPIPSSHSSEQDGFDSASSVAAAGTLRASVGGTAGGLMRRDTPALGSGGISRRSSVMRNLNALVGGDHDETPVMLGAAFGSGAHHHHTSPPSRSCRSSISLSDVAVVKEAAARAVREHDERTAAGHGTPPPVPRPRSNPEQPMPLHSTSRLGLRSAASIGPGPEGPLPAPTAAADTPTAIGSPSANGSPTANGTHAPANGGSAGSLGTKLWGALLPLASTFEAMTEQQQAVAGGRVPPTGQGENGASGSPDVAFQYAY